MSVADLAAPRKAQKAYQRGRRQAAHGHYMKARQSLNKAVALHPRYASAWYFLGLVYSSERQRAAAREAYRSALEADPKSWRTYAGLAELAAAERNWMQLAENSSRALALAPEATSRLYLFNALARYHLGDLDGAERSAHEALERTWIKPDPMAYQILGLVDARRARWESARSHLRLYLSLVPDADDTSAVRKQLAAADEQYRRMSGEEPEFVLHPSGMFVRNHNKSR